MSCRFLLTVVVVSHAMASFLTSPWINDMLKSVKKVAQLPKPAGVFARACLAKVEAHVVVEPSFMNERVKANFF